MVVCTQRLGPAHRNGLRERIGSLRPAGEEAERDDAQNCRTGQHAICIGNPSGGFTPLMGYLCAQLDQSAGATRSAGVGSSSSWRGPRAVRSGRVIRNSTAPTTATTNMTVPVIQSMLKIALGLVSPVGAMMLISINPR